MLAVVVRIEVGPGRMPEFLPLVLQNARSSLGEPACRRFDVLTDPDRPNAVLLYELYDDAAGFEAHKATPHYASFDAAAAPLLSFKEVTIWRTVER